MKRRFFYLVVLLAVAQPGFSQLKIGLKGGANLSQIEMNINGIELDSYNARAGVHIGLMAEYMFWRFIGLQSELTYFNGGANINPEQFKRWFDVGEDVSLTGHMNMHTLQLPIYVKAKFSIAPGVKVYAMGGGFASYALKGEMFERLSVPGEDSFKVKWSLYDSKVHIFNQVSDNVHLQHRLNAGLAAEAGVEIASGVTIGVGFKQVLNNVSAVNMNNIRLATDMWMMNASVGYMF